MICFINEKETEIINKFRDSNYFVEYDNKIFININNFSNTYNFFVVITETDLAKLEVIDVSDYYSVLSNYVNNKSHDVWLVYDFERPNNSNEPNQIHISPYIADEHNYETEQLKLKLENDLYTFSKIKESFFELFDDDCTFYKCYLFEFFLICVDLGCNDIYDLYYLIQDNLYNLIQDNITKYNNVGTKPLSFVVASKLKFLLNEQFKINNLKEI